MKQIKPLMQREKPRDRRFNDLEGETFGRLKVVGYAGGREVPRGRVVHYWNCKCACGSGCIVEHGRLLKKNTESCGCSKIKHGGSIRGKLSTEYLKWGRMKVLCLSPGSANYKYYGGRGISICDRWIYSFENFLSDMGPRPADKGLGRIDTNGNFEPGNCKWMSRSEIRKGRRKMPAREEAA